jgi:hypothetical protein
VVGNVVAVADNLLHQQQEMLDASTANGPGNVSDRVGSLWG